MELKTKTLKDRRGWEEVLEPITIMGVEIPAGYQFDGASTPRLFYSIVPPFKGTKEASLRHDYLCSIAKTKEERKVADEGFLEMLKEEPTINIVRAYLGYAGVRIGAFFGVGVRYPHWTNKWKGRDA